jgi:hypothetical protein
MDRRPDRYERRPLRPIPWWAAPSGRGLVGRPGSAGRGSAGRSSVQLQTSRTPRHVWPGDTYGQNLGVSCRPRMRRG